MVTHWYDVIEGTMMVWLSRTYGGFLKYGYPGHHQLLDGMFHDKPSVSGKPHWWKPHILPSVPRLLPHVHRPMQMPAWWKRPLHHRWWLLSMGVPKNWCFFFCWKIPLKLGWWLGVALFQETSNWNEMKGFWLTFVSHYKFMDSTVKNGLEPAKADGFTWLKRRTW